MANKTVALHEIIFKDKRLTLKVDAISYISISDKTIEFRVGGQEFSFECGSVEEAENVYRDIRNSMNDNPCE